jgi:hypothetical protein
VPALPQILLGQGHSPQTGLDLATEGALRDMPSSEWGERLIKARDGVVYGNGRRVDAAPAQASSTSSGACVASAEKPDLSETRAQDPLTRSAPSGWSRSLLSFGLSANRHKPPQGAQLPIAAVLAAMSGARQALSVVMDQQLSYFQFRDLPSASHSTAWAMRLARVSSRLASSTHSM